MAETPPGGPSYGQSASGFPGAPGQFSGVPSGPPSWASSAPRGASRLLTFVSLGISVVATVLAIVGWFRPAAPQQAKDSQPAAYSSQQISEAKTKACSAVDTVHKGAMLHTGTGTQSSSDPAMAEALAADGRLALIGGGWYLRDHLDPATPSDLVDAIKHLSQVMLDLGANYLAGAKNADPDQATLINDGNAAFAHAQDLCK